MKYDRPSRCNNWDLWVLQDLLSKNISLLTAALYSTTVYSWGEPCKIWNPHIRSSLSEGWSELIFELSVHLFFSLILILTHCSFPILLSSNHVYLFVCFAYMLTQIQWFWFNFIIIKMILRCKQKMWNCFCNMFFKIPYFL